MYDAMKVRVCEIDLEMLYMVARGYTYKRIAHACGLGVQTVKNRMADIQKVFGCVTLPSLIATLISSDVLRVHDLYQELDVEVFEYKRRGKNRQSYRLTDVRM